MGKHSLPESPGFWRAVIIAGFRYLLILALVGALGFGLYKLVVDRSSSAPPPSQGASLPASPPQATPSPSGASVPTPAALQASSASAAEGSGRVQVLDGAASATRAAQAEQKLKQAGYEVTAVGKTSRPYEKTTVFYQPGFQQMAEAIGSLMGATAITAALDNLDKSIPVSVVVGADFTG